MISGTGIDIVDVDRIRESIEKNELQFPVLKLFQLLVCPFPQCCFSIMTMAVAYALVCERET